MSIMDDISIHGDDESQNVTEIMKALLINYDKTIRPNYGGEFNNLRFFIEK